MLLLSPEEQVKFDALELDDPARKMIEVGRDYERFRINNLKIRTKDAKIVSLIPKPIQQKVVDKVMECLLQGKPIRFIILKARQEGVSTIIESLIYWWASNHKNVSAKIVAHDTTTAEKLYAMSTRFLENSNPLFQPQTKWLTRNSLTFDNEEGTGLKSQIDTASADTLATGRGDTIHWLHGSEISVWRNGSELVAGLMQAVPLAPNTAIFLESTANGIGDYFHTTWQASKRGESAFTPLFFSWADDPEYQLPVPKDFQLTPEEKLLKKIHGLTNEQLVWRREKMKEFVDKPEKFFQEYPLTDAEAFLASGHPRFNIEKLVKMEEKCSPAQTIELLEKKVGVDTRIIPKPTVNAPLKVWTQPQDGKGYVIGADVAEGVGGDYSVATVMDKESHETVARWRGDSEPADFGEILEQLARWYNRALIGVEVNNHGLATVQRLRDMQYDNLYRREKGMDERYETATSKLGWRTDVKTKALMIDGLAEAIGKDQIRDPDLIFIRECMTYITDERGRTNAQIGQHDDTVISTAIALQLFEWHPVQERKYSVKSTMPKQYVDVRKKLKDLRAKRPLPHYAK